MAQVVEHLPSKCKVLSSNPSTTPPLPKSNFNPTLVCGLHSPRFPLNLTNDCKQNCNHLQSEIINLTRTKISLWSESVLGPIRVKTLISNDLGPSTIKEQSSQV
jgi:hypothetical protein